MEFFSVDMALWNFSEHSQMCLCRTNRFLVRFSRFSQRFIWISGPALMIPMVSNEVEEMADLKTISSPGKGGNSFSHPAVLITKVD